MDLSALFACWGWFVFCVFIFFVVITIIFFSAQAFGFFIGFFFFVNVVGVNLTSASYIYIMEPCRNPALEMQAINRAHRIGQKNTLRVRKLVIKNSIEERIAKLAKDMQEKDLAVAGNLNQDKSKMK